VVLPGFNFAGNAAVTKTGCGTTTFSAAYANSGGANAKITFKAATATLALDTACTLTIASGVSTAASVQAANLATRTAALTIAAGTNAAAKAIGTSTALAAPPPPPTPTPTSASPSPSPTSSSPSPTSSTPTPSSYSSGTTPTPAATTKYYVTAQVKLTGITVAQFAGAVRTHFKEVIAAGMDGVVAADVTITAVSAGRRSSVKVDFKVKVATTAKQTAGVTKLTTFLNNSAGFKAALVAKGGALTSVTGTAVTKAPAAKTETPTVSGVANVAIVSLTSMVALVFALLR